MKTLKRTTIVLKVKYWFTVLLTVSLFIFSCRKEYSCEGCAEKNKPPIAAAGPDRVITLPIDSVSLDGSASSDPDGKINEWLWTKISGPASFNIIRQSDSISKVKALAVGVYQFELKVTDNGRLSAKDTVQVIVNDPSISNRPPVANAGTDQTITLPTNTVTLNGNGSTDPDNNITSYLWAKISGPSSFSLANASAIQTQITNLTEGIYQLELKVTDAGGLFSKDTMQITVNAVVVPGCNSNRPLINVQLVPVGNLSQARPMMAASSAGNKILFAGGQRGYFDISSRVDIYDIVTNSWSTAELSVPRCLIASIAAGNKIFFAGGGYYDNGDNWHYYSTIDIYDVSTNTWSIDSLSFPGLYTAATVGNKVFFTGAYGWDSANISSFSNRVDIYDLSTNSWSTASLSEARQDISAVTVGNKIYFAGGGDASGVPSSRVDIYDNATNSWSVSSLNEPRASILSIVVADKIYWAGGYTAIDPLNGHINPTCTVEIKNVSTQNSSFASLFEPYSWEVYIGRNGVVKDNKIVFLKLWPSVDGNVKFDMYDIATNTWSIGVSPIGLPWGSAISVNNIIYVAGGTVNGTWGGGYSTQVWKMEF